MVDDGTGSSGDSVAMVNDISGYTSNSPGGPVSMIGLMVVIGLVAMSFPYKEGGILSNLQMSLFGKRN